MGAPSGLRSREPLETPGLGCINEHIIHVGFILYTHAAATEFFKDFVVGNRFADHDTLMNLFSIYYSGQSTINSLYNDANQARA